MKKTTPPPRYEKLYTLEWYEKNGGRLGVNYYSAKAIIPILEDILSGALDSKRVVDFGCGIGKWLRAFDESGWDVTGLDVNSVSTDDMLIDGNSFIRCDLSKPVDLGKKYGLAISIEVAEHLPLSAAETFVDSICRHSDLVLFGAAVVGQPGTHHINCQMQSYWAGLFDRRGYDTFDVLRPLIWTRKDVNYCHAQNILIYASRGTSAHNALTKKYIPTQLPGMLDVYHPVLAGIKPYGRFVSAGEILLRDTIFYNFFSKLYKKTRR